MNLEQQKNIFISSAKGSKAIAYARKWFNDFNSSKLEPVFLQAFYNNEIFFRGENADPYVLKSYDALFWFWFKARYQRIENDQQLAAANLEYEALIKEIESSGLFNQIGNLLSGVITYAPALVLGGLIIWGISVIKK